MSDTTSYRALIIMPPGEEFRVLRQRITASLQEVGIEVTSWDNIEPGGNVVPSIQELIRHTDIVIVDVTGSNSNAIFEMGYALGYGKPILPLIQRTTRFPVSDLNGWLYVVYDPSQLALATEMIKVFTLDYLHNRKAS